MTIDVKKTLKYWKKYLKKRFGKPLRVDKYTVEYTRKPFCLRISHSTIGSRGWVTISFCIQSEHWTAWCHLQHPTLDVKKTDEDTLAVLKAIEDPTLMPTCISIDWARDMVGQYLKGNWLQETMTAEDKSQ